MDRIEEKPECKHVDEKGLTTLYKDLGVGNEPLIICNQCKAELSVKEFRERVEYVAKCYEEGKPYV